MHSGFYEELDSLSEENGLADFGFLENVGGEYEIHTNYVCDGKKVSYLLNAYDFLHGNCNEFSFALNQRYGYPIFEIKDGSGNLVHSFNRMDTDSQQFFIDVRGITTDYFEFMSEFEDFIDIEESLCQTFPLDCNEHFKTSSKESLEFIENLLLDYGSYYDVASCLQERSAEEIER